MASAKSEVAKEACSTLTFGADVVEYLAIESAPLYQLFKARKRRLLSVIAATSA